MSENENQVTFCLTQACRAAGEDHSSGVDYVNLRLRELNLDYQGSEPTDFLKSPTNHQRPSLVDGLPSVVKQAIKDHGLRIGRDVFLIPGPGKGVSIQFRWK